MRKTCDPDKNVAPLCARRNRGSDSPGNEDGATIESVQRPHRSSSASKIAGTQVTLQRAIFTGGVCSVSQGDVRSRLRDKGRFGARSEQFPFLYAVVGVGWSTPFRRAYQSCRKKMRLQPLREGTWLPQRLKPTSEAILKCTAEAVLHPDSPTQNLL